MVSPVAEVGFVDTDRSTGPVAGVGLNGIAASMLSIENLDRLLLAAPFNFTQNRIDTMTLQDKQYAIKTAFDNGDVTALDLLPPVIATAAAPVDEVHPYGTVWHDTTAGGDVYQTAGDGNWIAIIAL